MDRGQTYLAARAELGGRTVAGLLSVGRTLASIPFGYLAVLTAAGIVARPRAAGVPSGRLVVLVPAHDEELDVAQTVRSLLAADWPGPKSVLVIADHCTDATALVAADAGAVVLERSTGLPGKSRALRDGLASLTEGPDRPDIVVVVDADTVVEPSFLVELGSRVTADHPVAQGHYGVRNPADSSAAGLRAAALAARHHLRPLGRNAIGASCGLYGNGMAFRTEILHDFPWPDHLTEDLQLQLDLVLAGVAIEYVPGARVEALMPHALDGATTQNQRWERGRLDLARAYGPRLLRAVVRPGTRRRIAVLDALLDLVTPPLSVLAALATGLGAASTSTRWLRGRGPRGWWMTGVLGAHLLVAMRLERVPAAVYRSFVAAPRIVVWKVALFVGVARRGGDVGWSRTSRQRAGAA